jgi:signal transduction histidine kinase
VDRSMRGGAFAAEKASAPRRRGEAREHSCSCVLPAICYGLLIVAWVIDLITPQLFVAAILLNGPIALSSLALNPKLTRNLIVLAEIANVVAGYTNGLQAGRHWDPIAIGDRVLLAASFLLVGVLTSRAQVSARNAGESDARERQIVRERALRHAMEHVRASLNMELVLRTAVREAHVLTGADHVIIAVRASSFDLADRYEMSTGDTDVMLSREPLGSEFSSLIERARESKRVVETDPTHPLGRLLGMAALTAVLDVEGIDISLILTWPTHLPGIEERAAVADFVDNLSVAVQQARLFIRLAEQNEEIVRQRNELQARSDVIRDIVYALAHDLRTPLAAADLTMSQALNGAYGELPERYRSVVRTSIGSNADLRRLVETLLLVARYESGEDSHTFAKESLMPVLTRIVEELRPIAEIKGVNLALMPPQHDVQLVIDADEIRRAVTNLVANALDATPEHGHVEIAVREENGDVRVEVDDDGFGVPPERRSALFQRFGGVRAGGGTGLGLYIVRRIAEKYGGRTEYAAREPRGSRFSIVLPRIQAFE